jgi:hypothetical protein
MTVAELVIANDIPFSEEQFDPFTSIGNILAFDSRDWSSNRGDAWLWGIVFGWGESYDEVARRHGWDAASVRRLRLLHLAYRRNEVHRTIEGTIR